MSPSDSVISYLFINAGSEHMLGSFTSVWKWRESNFTLILWTANSKGDEKNDGNWRTLCYIKPWFYVSWWKTASLVITWNLQPLSKDTCNNWTSSTKPEEAGSRTRASSSGKSSYSHSILLPILVRRMRKFKIQCLCIHAYIYMYLCDKQILHIAKTTLE